MIAHDSKSCRGNTLVGSNPTLSVPWKSYWVSRSAVLVWEIYFSELRFYPIGLKSTRNNRGVP